MLNKFKKTAKTGASKFFQSVLLTGGMLFFILKPGIAKDNAELKAELTDILKTVPVKEWKMVEPQENKEKIAKFEMMPNDTINAIDFAVQNVDQYYPDMKEHLTTMINSFRDEEHKEATNKLLNEMAEKIEDPAQKTGAIIAILEFIFPGNTIFSDKHEPSLTDETFEHIDKYYTDYKKRFTGYYQRLETKTEQLKEEIAKKQNELKTLQQELQSKQQELQSKQQELQSKQQELQSKQQELQKEIDELEKTMQRFSPEDIKNNPSIKNLAIETQKIYQTFSITPSPHTQSLFEAIK